MSPFPPSPFPFSPRQVCPPPPPKAGIAQRMNSSRAAANGTGRNRVYLMVLSSNQRIPVFAAEFARPVRPVSAEDISSKHRVERTAFN